MRRLIQGRTTEFTLLAVMVLLCVGLSFGTDRFLTISNAFDVLNVSAVNIIFAVGLLVVLISGGIDISFAVAASVVQYLTVLALTALGGGNWAEGFLVAGIIGIGLGAINAFLVYRLQIISIVATISTFNIFFGLLMFFTKGVSIYNLPDWLSTRVVFYEHEMADGSWVELTLPVVVMILCCAATSFMISRTTTGRKLYAFGDNPEGARRFGINISAMHYISFGWLGLMAGIAGLMQAHYAQEVVPNALYGRELDVLAATVLGGARLGGGKGSVMGCVLGVLLVSITQNGLNLMGVSPFAFKMIVGAIILIAITLSSARFDKLLPDTLKSSARKGGQG
ncbi:ABC transporter permease [Rhizobium oryzicola]|uniref:ABC transporter permease n=1 Tax=Rhizobium oryzicola TaxID=1232668 RepID=A0ABT8SYR8_9HYPH|nr:ABC transporter permease [Rhizobium oryzicola]MDO1583501.1 ABC transporter permease [Rhizobium oryzicola]